MPVMPSSLFSDIFPDRLDLDNPGNYLCRFCGKPTVNSRRRYWCSDECYDLSQLAVSWLATRKAAWERDEHRCQICKEEVQLHGHNVCESHHMVPVRELWRLAWDVVYDVPLEQLHWRRGCYDPTDPEELYQRARRRAFSLIYTLLFLDVNNLKTYCVKCHDIVHSADMRTQTWSNPFEVAPTYWANFWIWAKRDRFTRTLDQFFNPKDK